MHVSSGPLRGQKGVGSRGAGDHRVYGRSAVVDETPGGVSESRMKATIISISLSDSCHLKEAGPGSGTEFKRQDLNVLENALGCIPILLFFKILS